MKPPQVWWTPSRKHRPTAMSQNYDPRLSLAPTSMGSATLRKKINWKVVKLAQETRTTLHKCEGITGNQTINQKVRKLFMTPRRIFTSAIYKQPLMKP